METCAENNREKQMNWKCVGNIFVPKKIENDKCDDDNETTTKLNLRKIDFEFQFSILGFFFCFFFHVIFTRKTKIKLFIFGGFYLQPQALGRICICVSIGTLLK